MRRFLQGLGLGLLVAAILMGVGIRSNGSSSDDNIIERAREIGMVFPKEAGDDTTVAPEASDASAPEGTEEPTEGGSEKGAGVGGDDSSSSVAATEAP